MPHGENVVGRIDRGRKFLGLPANCEQLLATGGPLRRSECILDSSSLGSDSGVEVEKALEDK